MTHIVNFAKLMKMKAIYKIIVIFFTVCIFSSLACYSQNASSYYDAGYKAFKNNDYKSAIYNFEKVLQINENVYDAYCFLGMSYGLNNDVRKSEEILIKAIKKFPDKWNAYTFLGDIKRAQHLTSSAIDYYEKAMSLPSMAENERKYFAKLIQEVIKEQKAYEGINASAISRNITPDITLDLDKNIWTLAYLKGNQGNWLMEYGLKGEDVINYKWSKLITINFFSKNRFNTNVQSHYTSFVAKLKNQADTTNRALSVKEIRKTDSEIYFEWSIIGRNECEIVRIFTTDKGLYFAHYAQKTQNFTPEQRMQALKILQSVKQK